MCQALQGATFHLEHIVPNAQGGSSEPENLALACPSCNLHKADRTEAVDPETGTQVPLFNPRLHTWADHFSWRDYHAVGLTAIGRATVVILQFNSPRHLLIREAEENFGLFPP
jgi:hypothetical protein